MIRSSSIALLVCLIPVGQAVAQGPPKPLRTVLRVQSAVPWQGPMPPYSTVPVSCQDHFVYFPGADSPLEKIHPTWKVDYEKGAKDALFEPPGKFREDFESTTYAVAPAGNVFVSLMQIKTGEAFILRFSSDGSYLSRVRLSVPGFFRVEQLAAFDTDQLFVAGYVTSMGAEQLQRHPLLAIFSPDGELVRKVSAARAGAKEELVDPAKLPDRALTIGDNGYVYYLSGRRIIAVSAAGKIERNIPIETPEKDYIPTKVDYSEGVVSVTFMQDVYKKIPKILFRTYDANSGELLGEFAPGDGITNSQFCYSRREGYLFTGKREGKPAFVRAAPE